MRVIITALLCIFSLHAYSTQLAEELLQNYQSFCPNTYTPIYKSAHDLNIVLRSTVKALYEDESCSDIYSKLRGLELASSHLSLAESKRNADRNKINAEQRILEYGQLLSAPQFNDQHDFLLSEILSANSELIGYDNESKYYEGFYKDSDAQQSYQTVLIVNEFLESLSSSPGCFDKNSSSIIELVGSSLQISSLFLAPGSAVGIAAAANLVHSINYFYRKYKTNKKLSNIADTLLPTALSCASEAYASKFCELEESKKLLQFRFEDRTINDDRLAGFKLVTEHLDYNLKDWLQKIYAGGVYTTSGNIYDREKPIGQIFIIERIERRVQQISIEKRNEFLDLANRGGTIVEKRAFLARIINRISLKITPDCTFGCKGDYPNPFIESGIESDVLPYSLFNQTLVAKPYCNDQNTSRCSNLAEYLNYKGIQVSIEDLDRAISNAFRLINKERARVEIIRTQLNSLDPIRDLRSRYDMNPPSMSAHDTLVEIEKLSEKISNYLDQLGNQTNNRKYISQAYDVDITKELTHKVLNLLNSTDRLDQDLELPDDCTSPDTVRVKNSTAKEKATLAVNCMVKLLDLDKRLSSLYFNKVRSMVRYELNARIEQGEFDDDFTEILAASRKSLLEDLKGSHPENMSYLQIERNIEVTMKDTYTTYKKFFNTFKNYFVALIKSKKTPQIHKENLCLWALTYTGTTKSQRAFTKEIKKYCEPVVLTTKYKNETNQISWVKSLEKTNEEKVCIFRDFYRKEKLLDKKYGE